MIDSQKALEIARTDAEIACRDLSIYRIEIRLDGEIWYVDYELRDENMLGGGPHYPIDAHTGAIVRKKYEQ